MYSTGDPRKEKFELHLPIDFAHPGSRVPDSHAAVFCQCGVCCKKLKNREKIK